MTVMARLEQNPHAPPPDAPSGAAGGFDWVTANQAYLRAALDVVGTRLAHAVRGDGAEAAVAFAECEMERSRRDLPAPAALDALCAAFALSPFERDVLLLCAGPELDSDFGSLLAATQDDQQRPYPTFSLALALLPGAHWSALAPAGPLRRWRLLEIGSGPCLANSPLHLDERVLHHLLGVDYLDDRLRGLVDAWHQMPPLLPSHRELAEQVARLWSRQPDGGGPAVVQLCGRDAADKRAVAAAACGRVGLSPFTANALSLPADPRELEALARLWEREAVLSRAVLVLDCDDLDPADTPRAQIVRAFLDSAGSPVILTGREPRSWGARPLFCLDVERPTTAERQVIWRRELTAAGFSPGHAEVLAAQFGLNAAAVHAAVAAGAASGSSGNGLGERLWQACRVESRPRLDALARRIGSNAGWSDLVLPTQQLQALRELAGQVRQRARVYEEWGFAASSGRGLGITALFSGASGTGKTLAAEVLANELRLDLYRVDLSQVVSKYIGETEKNLRRVFDAAEDGAVVLLFDEADALFGKRGEVRDSHDRYANIEISYLLQRMEAYRGLAILTTNMKEALDAAFLRRIRFLVSFPFPDVAQRLEIWRRVLPAAAPTAGVDLGRLARLGVAGGTIRNIALNAAFLAADADEPLRMPHLLRAARTECAKLERPLTAAETADWV